MKELTRKQVIKMLTDVRVYNILSDEDLYLGESKYASVYDIMGALDVPREEVDYVQNLTHKELGLLDN